MKNPIAEYLDRNNDGTRKIDAKTRQSIFAAYLNAEGIQPLQHKEHGRQYYSVLSLLSQRPEEMELWALNLKPLGEISDEDKAAVEKIEKSDDVLLLVDIFIGKTWDQCYCNAIDNAYIRPLYVESFQYLQSKGYALPYGPYSVEQLVEAGIYRLTPKL